MKSTKKIMNKKRGPVHQPSGLHMQKKEAFNSKLLRSLMKNSGHTFLTLSRAIKIYEPKCSKTSVWQWCTGKQYPSLRYLFALSKIFNCDPLSFYNEQ